MDTKNINSFYQKFTIARNRTSSAFPSMPNLSGTNLSRPYSNLPKSIKRNHVLATVVIILLVVAFLAGRYFTPTNSTFGNSDQRADAPTPLATQNLNTEFKFPLKDDKGKEVAQISYFVKSSNLQDSFIFQGKMAKAIKGRTFLIFDLKITNPYTKTIEINAKDYIRIKANDSDEQLAPEIHNDPVQIQSNSTKYTRIGLPINDSDKDITILIGELSGKKQTIKLDLKR